MTDQLTLILNRASFLIDVAPTERWERFLMYDEMKKGEHYRVLKDAGLPIPHFGVFDSSCLSDEGRKLDLTQCVAAILDEGSGLVGVRTEPKKDHSALGNFPHYMPLRSLDEVIAVIKRNEHDWPQNEWWYLVNEAFLDYEWNAVLKLTQQGSLPGYWSLDGEVNLTDNLPLRIALGNSTHLVPAKKWVGNDSANLRRQILQSGLLETWLEVSKVRTPKAPRLVFWGMRGADENRRFE